MKRIWILLILITPALQGCSYFGWDDSRTSAQVEKITRLIPTIVCTIDKGGKGCSVGGALVLLPKYRIGIRHKNTTTNQAVMTNASSSPRWDSIWQR